MAENELNCLPTVTVNPQFCSTVWVWVSNVPLPVESSYTVWALNYMGMSEASNRPNKHRVFMGPMDKALRFNLKPVTAMLGVWGTPCAA